MDVGTIAGVVVAFLAVVVGVLVEGGHLGSYFSLSAALIVLGGSFGATVIGSPLRVVLRAPVLLMQLVRPPVRDMDAAIELFKGLARVVRTRGPVGVAAAAAEHPDPFLQAGVRLIVDGAESSPTHVVLATRLDAIEEEGRQAEKLFESLGGFCPTMGIVGTVTGLIHVLGNLAEPAKLGTSIAIAFIATLYGIAFANLVFLPFANKLRVQNDATMRYYRMMAAGLLALQDGQNPVVVVEIMESFLAKPRLGPAAAPAPAEEAPSQPPSGDMHAPAAAAV